MAERREDGQVLINVGHPSGEGDVFLVPQITTIIKPHQVRRRESYYCYCLLLLLLLFIVIVCYCYCFSRVRLAGSGLCMII